MDNPCTEAEWARHQRILEAFNSYTERSVSGRGYHIVVRGKLPSGVNRDKVEAYSSSRYMIFTGDVVRAAPITDHQHLLDVLYAEMAPAPTAMLEQYDGPLTDAEIVAMGMRAVNCDKFNSLCNGEMTDYPSQSEADFALLSIIAFYTRDNEQVRRIFRMSKLGKRDKATRNNVYLDRALKKIRAQQPQPLDMAAIAANAAALLADPAPSHAPAPEAAPAPSLTTTSGLTAPPGLIGELAAYFYATAIRPVPEVALMAAIALVAGIVARSYNISGTGLNQYLILLAKTGSGKEGALAGIENLMAAVRPQVPMVDEFIGPAAFASGQALIKTLNDRPCFVSVLGEFGITLQQLSDSRANSAQLMLRKVLLDLYAKSGWNRTLRSSVYSDSDKNTKSIQAPNVTIFGESTPENFFDGLDSGHIAEGLVPRFSIVEYTGGRPPRNRNANCPPSPQLAQRFMDMITVALTTTNNNTCAPVQMDAAALDLMDDFDVQADAVMNGSQKEVEVQLWNRAHLKALKLAALVAVGINPHQPMITAEVATWAMDFVKRDVALVSKRFADGDVGKGDSKQFVDLKRVIQNYFEHDKTKLDKYLVPRVIREANLVPYAFMMRGTSSMASYRHDRQGSTAALKKMVALMVDAGLLVEITKQQVSEKYAFSGVVYGIGKAWF